jgi:response regulator RpfG family c-di-GMP phosphodiesterase
MRRLEVAKEIPRGHVGQAGSDQHKIETEHAHQVDGAVARVRFAEADAIELSHSMRLFNPHSQHFKLILMTLEHVASW